MKKVVLAVLAIIVSVAFVATVFAQQNAGEVSTGAAGMPVKVGPGAKDTGVPSVAEGEPAVSAGAAKIMVFKGEVVRMDAAAKTIVVKDKKGEKTFAYGEVKKMGEFKAGDKVTLQYGVREGKLWAANIKKVGAEASPKTPAADISSGAQAAGEAKPASAPKPAPAKQ
jgi:hypothetical protein